jgi:hypothetical protein
MIKEHQNKDAIIADEVTTCQSCSNTYLIVWLKQGHDYNDFSLRHCPYCGLLTDAFTGNVMV